MGCHQWHLQALRGYRKITDSPAVSSRFYFSPAPGLCMCFIFMTRWEKTWLNKDQLLFIHLLSWLIASESHSSGLKIDRWLLSLYCEPLKFALWCDYSTYLACAPGGKVDLWSYCSFKNHRSWKMNQSRKMLGSCICCWSWLSSQFNWPALPRILILLIRTDDL